MNIQKITRRSIFLLKTFLPILIVMALAFMINRNTIDSSLNRSLLEDSFNNAKGVSDVLQSRVFNELESSQLVVMRSKAEQYYREQFFLYSSMFIVLAYVMLDYYNRLRRLLVDGFDSTNKIIYKRLKGGESRS